MKKKVIILVCSGVALLLAILGIVLIFNGFHKSYIKKTTFDHVSTVSYNDVRIVGNEGLLYLWQNGEIVSDGYISLRSVNDGYAEDGDNWLEAEDTILFDYYIARRAGQSQYFLVTSSGEEYKIAGDNYSLASIQLPYLIFVNNTTGGRAAVSLLQLDSDLSKQSKNELSLTPFLEATPLRKHPEDVLYSHLETKDATDTPYSVFTIEGKRILSAQSFERREFSNNDEQASVYYANNDTHTVYASRGEQICVGSAAAVLVNDRWGYMPLALNADGSLSGIAVFSYQRDYLITDSTLDFSATQIFDGAIAIPSKEKAEIALYRAIDGEVSHYSSLGRVTDGLLRATNASSTESLYLSEDGYPLLQSPYADITLDLTLSTDDCLVLTSAEYDAAHEDTGTKMLYFARRNASAIAATLDSSATVTQLSANGGALTVDGVFLIRSEQNGLPSYRLLTPFSDRLFSDAYDSIEVFDTAGILWARGTSFEQKTYTILDPLCSQIASTVSAEGEALSKLVFEYVDCQYLLVDPYDSDSAIPVLLFRLSSREDGNIDSSIHYFALYRSAPASSKTFDEGMLRILEVGKNLVRAEPITFFADDNAIICRNTDFSHVYRMSASYVLSEVATLPYRVSDVISDQTDSTVKYFEVATDDGKYGLYNMETVSILAPYYDKIVAVNDGHIVVKLRGAYGVLSYEDGKLRQVIDYLYTKISALPDHGYLVTDGNGVTDLFDGGKKISRHAIQSSSLLRSYIIAENGSLQIRYSLLISTKGKLFLHETELADEPLATNLAKPDTVYTDIQNTRAVAVCYYHGKDVAATDLIYPTPEHQARFALAEPPAGYGWYEDPMADPVTATPVTAETVIASGKHTVKLYAIALAQNP